MPLRARIVLARFGISLPGKNNEDVLLSTAKRYRIDIEKIEKELVQEFSATPKKSGNKSNPNKTVA